MADPHRRRRRSRYEPTTTGDPEPPRDKHRRRSRKDRRHTDQTPTPQPPKPDPVPQPPRHPTPPPPDHPSPRAARDDEDSERGLRGLIGAGSSQITPTAALRARDAARPTPEDLATADQELTLIRRHWVPR
jgi:hypothetical protein